jgi:hypothetical protein
MASRLMERLLDGPGAGDSSGPAALLADEVRLGGVRPVWNQLPRRPQATADTLSGPDWGLLMELCDKVNADVLTCVPAGRLPTCCLAGQWPHLTQRSRGASATAKTPPRRLSAAWRRALPRRSCWR